MGLGICVEDEIGNMIGDEVGDPRNILHRLLPDHDDSSFICLRFIDWYGDTLFNTLQLPLVRSEFARIKAKAQGADEHALLNEIDRLIVLAQSEVHLYLRFIGD